MLTKKEFDSLSGGEVFATGILPNAPAGLFMTDAGGDLRWVATKGHANDWAIYCYWARNSVENVKAFGDKVIQEHHIRLCVPCDDDVFKAYRY